MLLSLLLLFAAEPTPAPSLLGDWITPDKSIVEVYSCKEAVCIRVAHVDAAVGHSTDGQNPDASLRSRPLCGLVIGTGFAEKDPAHAQDGRLYDPESGHTYSGTLTLTEPNRLKLHGYIGVSLFGRTETWQRATIKPPACS